MKRTVIFYRKADGKCPVRDFLDSLPSQTAQKVTWVLKLVEDFDIVPASYFKKLPGTDGLWEFRIKSGSNTCRIFCFFSGNSIVVLTHGFIKKTQRTPRSEIQRAESYRKDYLERRKNERS